MLFPTFWIHVDTQEWWARRVLQSQKFLRGSLAFSWTSLQMKHSDGSAEEEEEEKSVRLGSSNH